MHRRPRISSPRSVGPAPVPTNRRRAWRGAGAIAAGAALAATVVVVGTAPAHAGGRRSNGAPTNWTTYHANSVESGVAPTKASFTRPTLAWTSPTLDGQLFGEPLVEGNLVVVATENDVVYALNGANGTVVWSTTVGTPVPAGSLPCGDILPNVGITSTPVIDAARSEVFVVADEVNSSVISHHLVGLALTTGTVLLDQPVDPAGTLTKAQLQRPALALDQGSVEIAFGGNAGDCSTYHGWVVSVPETGGALTTFEVDPSPGNDQGAVWLGGAAPVVDGNGNIWFATGNGSNTSGSPDFSDSVVELSPSLGVVQTFTPSTWPTDNATDADLGSSPPALIGKGLVFMAGKSQTAYLLNQSALGGVGGQVAQRTSFCGNDVDGGEAFTSTVVYAPCVNGIVAVKVNVARPQDASDVEHTHRLERTAHHRR